MRTIILPVICLLSFVAPVFCQVTPENIVQKQYEKRADLWKFVFYQDLVDKWVSNDEPVILKYGSSEYGTAGKVLTSSRFQAEIKQEFAENGWAFNIMFPETYAPGEDVIVTISAKKYPEKVQFFSLGRGEYCNHTSPGVFVIKDAKTWQEHGSVTGVAYVDFRRYMVIAVYAGQFNTGGHKITIERIEETKDAVNVCVTQQNPPHGMPVTMALSQPYHIVMCKRIDKEVKVMHAVPGKPEKSEQIQFNRIFAGFGPRNFEKNEFLVVQDRKAYHELVAGKLNIMYENLPDFENTTVLAVFAGYEITKISEETDKVTVLVEFNNTKSAEPSFIVKCRKLTKPIKFTVTARGKQ